MPEIFRIEIVDGLQRPLLEAVALEEPDERDIQQLAATAHRFGLGKPADVRMMPMVACRVCGCTEDRACHDIRAGGACHWVNGTDLCSRCAGPLGVR